MDDNLYPSDGTYFNPYEEPKEQVSARKKEKAKVLEGISVLNDLIERLESRIEFYESITSIPDSVRTKPKQFLIMHNTHSLVAKILLSELEYLTSLLEEHAPGR